MSQSCFLVASCQRRRQRWLDNSRIDVESLYGQLILWGIEHGQNQATPFIWPWISPCFRTASAGWPMPGPSSCSGRPWASGASVSASVSIALLEKADQLLAGFGAITILQIVPSLAMNC